MSDETMECDLLVIGAGMAGLSAAGWAAERGARVVVVEKALVRGGSAVLSGGILWTASSPRKMAMYGCGDPALGEVVLNTYPDALAWLRKREVQVSPAMSVLHGKGYATDLIHHLDDCIRSVEKAGGHIVYETSTECLLKDEDGRVVGARTVHADGTVDVKAPWTLLATGGYQGSKELRAQYIHENARDILLRANTVSAGDGIRLGSEVGGHVPGTNPGFYGHLVSKPNSWGEERYFTMLTQYHSDHALLFNEEGVRFCDESVGDHTNSNYTVYQSGARAICLWDRRVQDQYAAAPVVASVPPIDKFQVAIENGGEGVIANDLQALEEFANAHGFNGKKFTESLIEYNEKATNGWETMQPPRTESCVPMVGPFYALIVYPAITFTYGGLDVNPQAQVLDKAGAAIPGLLAAGSDAGGAYGLGYAGGLALAMTFGMVAARTAGWK
jgi:succinate dehydrogenase/fumarate reductase flavoprotein subunit